MGNTVQYSRREIRELIGAIVLTTQELERYLKFIVPFTNTDDASWEGLMKRMSRSQKQTFGELLGKLLKASTSNDPNWQADCERIIKFRNNVVHHFQETFGKAYGEENFTEVASELRSHLNEVFELRNILINLSVQILDILKQTTLKNMAKFDDIDKLIGKLNERVAS